MPPHMLSYLLDSIPDHKIGYVLAYIQGITADEAADDTFCQHLVDSYIDDPDPTKDDTFTLEDCKKEWGLA